MNILLLSTSDLTGGAAVAASRLLHALKKQGVEVRMLVRDKRGDNPDVVPLNTTSWKRRRNWLRFAWERFVIFLCNRFSHKNLFQVSIANTGTDISRHPLVLQADVIHLHWINQGMLSLRDLEKLLALGKPVVWTLHDLWAATAICHYPGACSQYASSCRRCPMLVGHPLWNLASRVFRRKQQLGLQRIGFVGCSRWIVSACRKSALLEKAVFRVIPNPIDVSVFHPFPKPELRAAKHLPTDKKLILFAAAKLSDLRKGANFFVAACRLLSGKFPEAEVLLMGSHAAELQACLPLPSRALGYLSSSSEIAEAYAAADVFVVPSLEDNLPNTIMEAMACGTPCVGFRTGGIPEMIEHQRTGYVADSGSAEDLARGIAWVLEYAEKADLARHCLEKVRAEYAEETVARQYLDFYRSFLPSK